MSDINAPLLPAKETLKTNYSILKTLPALLDEKHKHLLSDCVPINNLSDYNLESDSPSQSLTIDGAITSIISHSDGTLTYGTDSGHICKLTKDLKLIHSHEEDQNSPIYKLLQSPDEKFTVALRKGENLLVLKDGHKHILSGHHEQVTSVALNNTHIATSDKNSIVYIWDSNDLQLISKYEGHKAQVLSMSFFRHSNLLITTSSDKKIRILNNDEEIAVLSGHTGEIQTAIPSLDDKFVFSGGNDNTVRIWDTSDMSQVAVLRGHQDNVTQLQIIDSDLFVSAGDLTLIVWSSKTRALVGVLRGHTCSPTSVVVKDDFIYSASAESTIRVWKIETLKEVAVIEGHSKNIRTLAFLQGSIYSGSEDKSIRRNHVSTTGLLATLGKHKEWVLAVAISSNNQYILTGGGDKLIFVWNRFKLEEKLEGHTNWISRLAFINNDTQFISCSFDRTIKIWDFHTKTCLFTKSGHAGAVYCLAVGEKSFVTGSFDKTLKIWSFNSDSESITCNGHEGMVLGVALAKKAGQILSVSRDKTIRIWNSTTGAQLDVINLEDYAISICVSEFEEVFITGSYDKLIRIWDFKLREVINVLEGHNEKIDAVRLIRNDRYLVSGSSDFSIKVWNLADLSCITTYDAHKDRVRDLIISNDERFVISSSTDHKVKVWKFFTPTKQLTFQCVNNQWEGLYTFTKAKTPERWMRYIHIEPYNINLLHVYAYHNKYKLLAAALKNDFPFITSSVGENPLGIAIKRSACFSINEILLHYLQVAKSKPQNFANFVKVVENDLTDLARFELPAVRLFFDELVVKVENLPSLGTPKKCCCLPHVRKSEKTYVSAEKMLKEETETHDLVFERTLAKVDVKSGSCGSVKLVHNLLFNPVFDGRNSSFIRVLSNYKKKKLCIYILISVLLTIINAALSIRDLDYYWPAVLGLNIIFLLTEIIELVQDRTFYFKYFDNVLELFRCLWVIPLIIWMRNDIYDYALYCTIIVFNALKCLGIFKFIGCCRICYTKSLHVAKSLSYSVVLAVFSCWALGRLFYIENYISELFLTVLILGFFIFEGHNIPPFDESFKTKELFRVVNRYEKLRLFARSGHTLRYLHSLSLH